MELTDSTGYLLALVGAESRRLWVQALRSAGLRHADFGVLMTLGAASGCSQAELADALGIDPRNLVVVIDRLEERGLVDRARDPSDRRRHAVRLTAAGRRSLAALRKAGAGAERDLLSGLQATERRQLHRLLRKLAGF